jgi:hypothetical protein
MNGAFFLHRCKTARHHLWACIRRTVASGGNFPYLAVHLDTTQAAPICAIMASA